MNSIGSWGLDRLVGLCEIIFVSVAGDALISITAHTDLVGVNDLRSFSLGLLSLLTELCF
jgi:hypothetical protein